MTSRLFTTPNRILLGRIAAVILLACIFISNSPQMLGTVGLEVFELIGFALLCLASLGRIWCAVYISDRKSRELVMWGPYSVVRNPLYIFSLLGFVGFCLAIEKPLLALPAAIVYVAYYHVTIKKEEAKLIGHFGDPYLNYLREVPRWIPNFRLYKDPDHVVVSPIQIRRDILDAMWFLWAFLLWESIEAIHQYT